MRIGVLLPTFEKTVTPALNCARQAEDNGIHGVFCYDHLWPIGAPGKPAIAPFPLLGRLAAETKRVQIGTLVARIGLLADELLIGAFRTLSDVSERRVIAGLGTGDSLSAEENFAYGVGFAEPAARRSSLRTVAGALRGEQVEVWIGAGGEKTNLIARETGSTLNLFDTAVEEVAAGARLGPVSWGGPLPKRPSAAASRLPRLGRGRGHLGGDLLERVRGADCRRCRGFRDRPRVVGQGGGPGRGANPLRRHRESPGGTK